MLDLIGLISRDKDVLIEVFIVDRDFFIEGELIEGGIAENLVREGDRVCLRMSWHLKGAIDFEVYSKGRNVWFRLTDEQFGKVKNFLSEIQ